MTHPNHMEWDSRRRQTRGAPEELQLGPVGGVFQLQGKNVSVVPPSPMEPNDSGFHDLKRLRYQLGLNQPTQPIQQTQNAIALGLQALLQQKSKTEGRTPCDFSIVKQTVQLSTPKIVLPAPVIGGGKFGNELPEFQKFGIKEGTRATTQSKTKTFQEGPLLPLPFEEEENWFGVKVRKDLPGDRYEQGKVKYTSEAALKTMVEDLETLQHGITGCITNAVICDPEYDTYIKDCHFVSDQTIGKGSFGEVDLCYDSKTNKPFIRKQLKKDKLRSSEVVVPLTLDHRNITHLYGLIQRDDCQSNPSMELLLEFGGSSLNRYMVHEENKLSEEQIWDLTRQGLDALAHIGHYSIVHLDIKPENICILTQEDGSLVLKITDFGSSRLPHEPLKFCGVTPEYMAPEMCKLFLQTSVNIGLNWGLTEADITGKVDIFAFGLVIMYMYKGYHLLVKVINNGKTTYDGVSLNDRKMMHYSLLMSLADDNNASFVQNLLPDECDIDMRDLLCKLTEHKSCERFSAKQALDFIEERYRSKMLKVKVKCEVKVKKPAETMRTNEQLPFTDLLQDNYMCGNAEIPGIAEDCMESENGPVKNRTKDLLRKKIKPYGKKGMYMKQEDSKEVSAKSSIHEMRKLSGISSKRLPVAETIPPMTPVSEFESLSISQTVDIQARAIPESGGQMAQSSANGWCTNNRMEQATQQTGGETIVSLMQKKGLAAQRMRLDIPPALMKILLDKKLLRQPTVEAEPDLNPIDIQQKHQRAGYSANNTQHNSSHRESPVQMEEDLGNIPKFADFM